MVGQGAPADEVAPMAASETEEAEGVARRTEAYLSLRDGMLEGFEAGLNEANGQTEKLRRRGNR